MSHRMVTLFGIVASTAVVQGAQNATATLSPSEAAYHRGETATVCGHPAGFVCREEGTVFNFPGADGSSFHAFIPKLYRRQFGPRLEDRFGQRNVCVTGRIVPLGTANQIVISAVDQLVLKPGDPPPETVFGPTAYRPDCDPGVALPKLKRSVKPNYTAAALAAGIYGKVGLRGIVETDGRVGEVIVTRSVERGLDTEAVRAAKRFEFEPGTLDGVPVAVMVTFEIEFSIKGK